MNIFNVGLNNSIYDLIAGLAGSPGVYIAQIANTNPTAYDVLNFPSFLGNLPTIVGHGVVFPHQPFPYGFIVDPD